LRKDPGFQPARNTRVLSPGRAAPDAVSASGKGAALVDDEDFVINTGLRSVTVDTEDLGYNPLDDEGYQKIEPGDFVRVTGEMEVDFFEGKALEADSIVTLID
jgi:hypothetical protein